MKRSIFKKVFDRHVLSVLLLVSATLAVGNIAAAADGDDQSPRGASYQKSTDATHADNDESSPWERDLRMDGFDGARLIRAQFVPAPYCYTFAGPVCAMAVALPAGVPCTCPSNWGPLPGRTGF